MPPGLPISANTLTAGLRADFMKTYDPMYKSILASMGPIMQLGVPSNKLTELFAYYKSTIHPERWPRGQNRTSKGFDSVQFNITNKDWQAKIDWHKNDREDDQINGLFARAQQAGQNFAILPERIFFQILLATVDPKLLDAIPTAPDGAVLYATTAAGSARFGATNGNLLTGTGVDTAAKIRTDFFSVIQQFRLFQDTEGQPLFADNILDGAYTIIYGAKNEKVFREAFVQARTLDKSDKGAAETNIIMDAGLKFNLRSTQRITDNDWFVFLNGLPVKAIFQMVRQPLQSIAQNVTNSDIARNSKIESLMWDDRAGYGINVPYSTIKVNN